jgi:hypothetical protein
MNNAGWREEWDSRDVWSRGVSRARPAHLICSLDTGGATGPGAVLEISPLNGCEAPPDDD